MIGDISGLEKIYIVCGYTDLRKSILGFCAVIEDQLKMNPSSSALFLFCGRRREGLKALIWSRESTPGTEVLSDPKTLWFLQGKKIR